METIDLSDLFNTKAEAEDFSARLALLTQEAFQAGFNPEKALLTHFGIEKKETFMTLLRNNNVSAESRLAIKEFIDKVQLKINAMSVVSLVLAFEPTVETLQILSQWFILNTNKQVLFDIKIDKSIIGGASILSGGKYLDYSIKPAFDKIMKDTLFGHKEPAKAVQGPATKTQ